MAEFMILPTYSYFGDYQIFGNYKSQIRFKATDGDQCKLLMLLTIPKERFITLMRYFPEAKDYYQPRAEARRIEFKRLMQNFYCKLQDNCLLDIFNQKSPRLGKYDTLKDSSDEEGVSIEEILIRAANPDLKKYEKDQNKQNIQDRMVAKKISRFYDADCMGGLKGVADEINIQEYNTDDLVEVSEDEKPEDYSDLLPEDSGQANQAKVDSIHKNMDTVIEMYKKINEGLNENS